MSGVLSQAPPGARKAAEDVGYEIPKTSYCNVDGVGYGIPENK
jgi:hypothetical protein